MTAVEKHKAALAMLEAGFGWEDIRIKLSVPEVTVKAWVARWRADGTLAKLWPGT